MAGQGFQIDLFIKYYLNYLEAAITVQLTAFSVAIGTLIGLFAGMARISHYKIFNLPSALCRSNPRTPLLVQIMIVYWVATLGFNLDQYTQAYLLCLLIVERIAEIFKAGIKSIKKGQTEASISLGLNYMQTMRYVILPQATRNILPALGNEFIALLKDSSLVSVIAISELLRKRHDSLFKNLHDAWTPLLGVALIYLCITIQYLEQSNSLRKGGNHD